MDRSLWFLLWLRLQGWGRYIKRSVSTPKGIAVAVGALLLAGGWFTAIVAQWGKAPRDLELTRLYGPLFLFGLCLLNVGLSVKERILSFSAAEVNLLFTAPLSRRQLLLYKVITQLCASSAYALILALVVRPQTAGYLQALVAAVLFFQFFQLLLMTLALAASAIGAGRFRKQKIFAFVLLGLVVGVLLLRQGSTIFERDPRQVLEELVTNPALRVFLTPFRWVVNAAVSESYLDMLKWAALFLPFNVVLLFAIFGLDKYYLEAAASASEKRFAQQQKLRGGAFTGASLQRKGKPLYSLPSFPRLWGLGPLVWRQMLIGVRSPLWLISVGSIGVAMAVPLFMRPENADETLGLGFILGFMFFFMTGLIAPTTMTFDFRCDIDRMEVLKGLPLPTVTIVSGQILAPVLLLAFIQMLFMGSVQFVEGYFTPWWVLAFPFFLSLNFLVFAMHNLFFLWIPTRQVASGPGDIQTMVRHTLIWLGTFFVLIILFTVVTLVGLLTYYLTWKSWIATGGVVYLVITGFAFCMIPLMCLAFRQYDVSRDTPPE